MHPRFDQLLSGALEEEVALHVSACAECRTHFEGAQLTAARLRALPAQTDAPDRWLAIQYALRARGDVRSAPKARRPGWLLPAASAALVVIAVLITVSSQGPRDRSHSQSVAIDDARTGSAPVQVPAPAALIAESQRLEAVLASLPADARLTRAGTALTVADLEDRIRWVDYRLDLVTESGINPRQADLLWRERVELLNSLVAVRYADARTRAF